MEVTPYDRGVNRYTDADQAADLNASSFDERQTMEHNIHGVTDAIEETDEFVDQKIEELSAALVRIAVSRKVRRIWLRLCNLRLLGIDLYIFRLFGRRDWMSRGQLNLLSIGFELKRLLFWR